MLKRTIALVVAGVLLSISSVSCKRNTDDQAAQAPATENTAEKKADNEADKAVANDGKPAQAEVQADSAANDTAANDTAANDTAANDTAAVKPAKELPAEIAAAGEVLFGTLESIAAAGEAETCAQVLAELKKLDTDELKAKRESVKSIQDIPEEYGQVLQERFEARMIELTMKMIKIQRCESEAEGPEIDALMTKLLSQMDGSEGQRESVPAEADKAETEAAE